VTEADPGSEVAWMWRASVSLTPKDAAWCLTKVLGINPANRQAQEWLDKIRQLQDQPPAVTSRLSPPSAELQTPVRSTGAHRFTPSPDQPTVDNLPSVSPDRRATPSRPQAATTVQAMPAVSVPPAASPPPPLAPPKPALTQTDESKDRLPEPNSASKIILAVDDSLTVRRVITQALEGSGYRVITAADGYEALAKLKEVTPDLVVLDVALPGGMDGYQLCRQIRALKARPAIPVVMLSSRESLLDKVQSRLAGAVQYMTKPFKTEELVLNIRRHLKE
ncbi:MAG: response regulator, partial [Chloracidobacterium sp.]